MSRCLIAFLSFTTVPEFAAGKTYEYKYEAVLMAGLPEEGLARAGVKVLSKVWISEAAANTFILKVKPMGFKLGCSRNTETCDNIMIQ